MDASISEYTVYIYMYIYVYIYICTCTQYILKKDGG